MPGDASCSLTPALPVLKPSGGQRLRQILGLRVGSDSMGHTACIPWNNTSSDQGRCFWNMAGEHTEQAAPCAPALPSWSEKQEIPLHLPSESAGQA
jgi:hypothetical protein